MSSSISIPKRKHPMTPSAQASSPSASSSLSSSSPHNTPQMNSASPSPLKDEYRHSKPQHDRRPSLLSSSLSAQEHIVINVGQPDGPPRLITCVKASQGFDWNQEIFLPPHSDSDYPDLERRPDPVHEIVLTDEELDNMFPQ
ncbi:hypothetical protein MMC08_000159 [Hypocenomyce scalaris]|nr:hypothetical protein [Hypocenomyce scalaris]